MDSVRTKPSPAETANEEGDEETSVAVVRKAFVATLIEFEHRLTDCSYHSLVDETERIIQVDRFSQIEGYKRLRRRTVTNRDPMKNLCG